MPVPEIYRLNNLSIDGEQYLLVDDGHLARIATGDEPRKRPIEPQWFDIDPGDIIAARWYPKTLCGLDWNGEDAADEDPAAPYLDDFVVRRPKCRKCVRLATKPRPRERAKESHA